MPGGPPVTGSIVVPVMAALGRSSRAWYTAVVSWASVVAVIAPDGTPVAFSRVALDRGDGRISELYAQLPGERHWEVYRWDNAAGTRVFSKCWTGFNSPSSASWTEGASSINSASLVA